MIEHIEHVFYLLLLVLLAVGTGAVCPLAYMTWSVKGCPVGFRAGVTAVFLMFLSSTIILACAFISEVIV